jgi:hypothetical protein
MTLPNDPLEALNWAWNHWDRTWWLIGALGVGIAWTRKRIAEWSRNNSLTMAGTPAAKAAAGQAAAGQLAAAQPAAGASALYAAAPSYAAAGYTAQPAYAAPPAAAPAHAPSSSRKLYREAAAPQRTVAPAARSVDVPAAAAASGRWTLEGAFGDPAHARTAIVVAEVLGPPLGLR